MPTISMSWQCAVTSATRISRILRRQPRIDLKEDGLTLNANIGNIVMKDAEFSYPNREQSHVIRNVLIKTTLQTEWKGFEQIDSVNQARREGGAGGPERLWEVYCDQCKSPPSPASCM